MPLGYVCTLHRAAPCIYDSRFDETKTVLAHGGRVKRQHKYVSKNDVLPWVGYESRHKFTPINQETIDRNEKDRLKLVGLLRALDVPGLTGDEPLHVLGKSYNYWDPRMSHVRSKSEQISEVVPIIGLGIKVAPPVAGELTTCDKTERAAIIEFLEANGERVRPNTGLERLREKKAAKEEELAAAAAGGSGDEGDGEGSGSE